MLFLAVPSWDVIYQVVVFSKLELYHFFGLLARRWLSVLYAACFFLLKSIHYYTKWIICPTICVCSTKQVLKRLSSAANSKIAFLFKQLFLVFFAHKCQIDIRHACWFAIIPHRYTYSKLCNCKNTICKYWLCLNMQCYGCSLMLWCDHSEWMIVLEAMLPPRLIPVQNQETFKKRVSIFCVRQIKQ